ncbi:MAG TPA: sigma 54-interacting transcriptional regulator [Candidatus Fermentibacter daniensis]|jgi:PAS domain S-box-containing protein|nr:MAG: Fis family transcriptional regulator [Candidatus Fermentibacter daniensis]MBP7719153.1 sigma 54-interacting transcriptional regulator [Candidatus Fermentibacter sp.]KZD16565.1 MAG: Fis family transcriptional regulator [Candidatus Fermentibacter daniensis]KZD18006.1 MAG: Fis family transcriptional regulator [Candidatus Fermentibacter daniensis]MCC6872126.1 sigma 54-interacting transcriptional regulator [Candidatus Fermentibacter sp.]
MTKRATTTEAILESISDGVFTVDSDWRITTFNRAAEEITGTPREEAVGKVCSDVFRCSMCETGCALRETLASGRPVIGRTGFIIDAHGGRVPISVSTAVLRDSRGRITGGAETFRNLSEIEALRKELRGRCEAGDIVSRSPLMKRIFEVLPAVAASTSTVLVQGETGTGKELLARTIHSMSPRSQGPFVAVNCSALPDTLLESELFGYKAGAFTGAGKDKPGRFALARGGTLFLDEIGELAPPMQVKLLRFLQDRRFEPLGAVRSESSDARVITATNRDLHAAMKEGGFREDLYYRVNVMRIEMPPLRRRLEDVPILVDSFIGHLNKVQGRSIRGISPEALSILMAHDWPGNVRELENVIERAFIVCSGETIGIESLPPELSGGTIPAKRLRGMRETRRETDAAAIRAAFARLGDRPSAVAKDLGIHRSTLYRMMKALGIERNGS